jgi:Scd6-like Sm domain
MRHIRERIGEEIHVISKSEIRYSGVLKSLDTEKDSLVIGEVRSHGTEDRPSPIKVPGSAQVYEYIVFKKSNISRISLSTQGGWIDLTETSGFTMPGEHAYDRAHEKEGVKELAGEASADREKKRAERKTCRRRGSGPKKEVQAIPKGDYDFTGNNNKMEKPQPDLRKGSMYYNGDVSFFDNISS